MQKSELIKLAIAKIEAARPCVSSYIEEHLDSDSVCSFHGSELEAEYNARTADWFNTQGPMIDHLKVAFSVAVADEYLMTI